MPEPTDVEDLIFAVEGTRKRVHTWCHNTVVG
jgi:hypothetical protein